MKLEDKQELSWPLLLFLGDIFYVFKGKKANLMLFHSILALCLPSLFHSPISYIILYHSYIIYIISTIYHVIYHIISCPPLEGCKLHGAGFFR